MSVFATIVVANSDKTEAQSLTSLDMFTTEFKKGFRKYWVSSGNFPQDYYDVLINNDLVYVSLTDQNVKPIKGLSDLGLRKVITEE